MGDLGREGGVAGGAVSSEPAWKMLRSTPGGTITTRSGSAPQRSTTVRASAALIAITPSDCVATSRSPGTRADDSGGSPSDSAEPGRAATE